ncbi:MAG TPA: hypothetical protein VE861_16730, partial [Gemmatimonadaceae bacterium]|nr:hypothetical protein [Gemmatimonadaceae bacterium]
MMLGDETADDVAAYAGGGVIGCRTSGPVRQRRNPPRRNIPARSAFPFLRLRRAMSLVTSLVARRLLITSCAAAGTLHAQSATPRAMTLRDWYRVTTVSQPAVSPSGKHVAFTVTTVREAENKRHQEVWVATTDGGAPQRWTSPGYESNSPRWSPDGTHLLFNSTR